MDGECDSLVEGSGAGPPVGLTHYTYKVLSVTGVRGDELPSKQAASECTWKDQSRKEEMEMMHMSFSAGARLLLRGGGGRWDIAQRPPKTPPPHILCVCVCVSACAEA